MNITSATLIYFPPTRTTRNVIEGIARGVQAGRVEYIDLTPPGARLQEFAEMSNELAIIGSPVYGGRLPIDMISRFRRLKGNGAPAVVVVAYGNRAYEDALIELRDLASEAGFMPLAAGAFIGEHSYSTSAAPIAAGRPDGKDLRKAEEFGKRIRDKIRPIRLLDDTSPLQVPGNFPYKERGGLSNISPITKEPLCIHCGECAGVCPSGAIAVSDTVLTDSRLCIRCCACVKACSTGARKMEDARVLQVVERLNLTCCDRKEPETYL